MAVDNALLHATLVTKLRPDTKRWPIERDTALESALKIMCSWSPVVELPETYNDDYKLIFVDVQVNVMSAGEDSFAETEQWYRPTTIALSS